MMLALIRNPNLWVLFGPLALIWGYVSFYFARNWWRRRIYVSLMLAFMPLGHLMIGLRELHLLTRAPAAAIYCASLVIGCLTALVLWNNERIRGSARPPGERE